jgi:hypothetical protein
MTQRRAESERGSESHECTKAHHKVRQTLRPLQSLPVPLFRCDICFDRDSGQTGQSQGGTRGLTSSSLHFPSIRKHSLHENRIKTPIAGKGESESSVWVKLFNPTTTYLQTQTPLLSRPLSRRFHDLLRPLLSLISLQLVQYLR